MTGVPVIPISLGMSSNSPCVFWRNRRHPSSGVDERGMPKGRAGASVGVEREHGIVLGRDVDHVVDALPRNGDVRDVERRCEGVAVELVVEQLAEAGRVHVRRRENGLLEVLARAQVVVVECELAGVVRDVRCRVARKAAIGRARRDRVRAGLRRSRVRACAGDRSRAARPADDTVDRPGHRGRSAPWQRGRILLGLTRRQSHLSRCHQKPCEGGRDVGVGPQRTVGIDPANPVRVARRSGDTRVAERRAGGSRDLRIGTAGDPLAALDTVARHAGSGRRRSPGEIDLGRALAGRGEVGRR